MEILKPGQSRPAAVERAQRHHAHTQGRCCQNRPFLPHTHLSLTCWPGLCFHGKGEKAGACWGDHLWEGTTMWSLGSRQGPNLDTLESPYFGGKC